jgi:lysozyme
MTPSPAILEFMEGWEGCRLTRYLDQNGNPTIGRGHLLPPGSTMETCTQDEADAFFLADVDATASGLTPYVPDGCTQQQFDALLSLAYNEGAGAVGRSTLMNDFAAGDLDGVGHEYDTHWHFIHDGKQFVVDEGLVRRRAAEKLVFFDGNYSGRP